MQRTPNLPSYIQEIVDENEQPGEFILTGSQQFEATNTINQSLARRTAILRLLPPAYQELFPKKQLMSLSNFLYTGPASTIKNSAQLKHFHFI